MNKKNFDDCSSLKFFNFENWKPEKIIEKYEVVLTSREKQITDLSMEIGSINERISFLSHKCETLEQENELLKNRLSKRENLLNQELNNKEIMFMRLERKEQECDELKKQLEKLTSKGVKEIVREVNKPVISTTNIHNTSLNNADINKIKVVKEEVISKPVLVNDNIGVTTNTENTNQSEPLTTKTSFQGATKSSALDKIREIKERKNNPSNTRINLTSSIIESQQNNIPNPDITKEIPEVKKNPENDLVPHQLDKNNNDPENDITSQQTDKNNKTGSDLTTQQIDQRSDLETNTNDEKDS